MKTINLLPPNEQEKLRLQKTGKLAVVLSCICLVSLLSLTLVLLALKFRILKEVAYQKTMLEVMEKKYQNPDFMPYKELISVSNADVQTANRFYQKQIHAMDALETILRVPMSEGINFTSFDAQKENSGAITMAIFGFSQTRDGLLDFKENLIAAAGVKNVNFPPESWIKPHNIEFTATLSVGGTK